MTIRYTHVVRLLEVMRAVSTGSNSRPTKIRHQEDIKAIDEKLAALARKGIVPARVGPWIKTEDIEAAVIE